MMTFRIRVCAASMMILLGTSAGVSTSPAAKSSGSPVSTKSKPVTAFELYYGGCSRSTWYRATYASLQEVTVAARQAGQKWKHTRIQSTDLANGIKGKYPSGLEVSYRVYLRSRCGQQWRLQTTHASLQEARTELKARYGKPVDYVQIIPHYTRKAVAVSRK